MFSNFFSSFIWKKKVLPVFSDEKQNKKYVEKLSWQKENIKKLKINEKKCNPGNPREKSFTCFYRWEKRKLRKMIL